MDAHVKQEILDDRIPNVAERTRRNGDVSWVPFDSVIELSSSSSDSDSDGDLDSLVANVVERGVSAGRGSPSKRRKTSDVGVVLPIGFLSPLPPAPHAQPLPPPSSDAVLSLPAPAWATSSEHANGSASASVAPISGGSKQFWKAGDYDGAPSGAFESSSTVGMDHVRVHPKFLHSNATSHKWALGAFAELLDNSLDETSGLQWGYICQCRYACKQERWHQDAAG